MNEEWEIIDEAPMYEVSNHGRVLRTRSGRVLRPSLSNGYPIVALCVMGQQFNRKIHRLVAKAFCEGYAPYLDVNHLDGNKQNNMWWNLEWTTRQENIRHAFRTGLSVSGRRIPVRIIETGEVFVSQTACAQAIGGYQSNVNAVLKGKLSHHLGYTFEYID